MKRKFKADVGDKGVGISPPDPLGVGPWRLIQHLLDKRHFVEVALQHNRHRLDEWIGELPALDAVDYVKWYMAHRCCL